MHLHPIRGYRQVARRQSAQRRRTTKTRDGVTHRLSWADFNGPGYRMRCACGWIDGRVRWTRTKAEVVGQVHVTGA